MSLNGNDLHLVIVSGFGGDADINALEEAVSDKLQPTNSLIIRGCPPYKAFRHPEKLVEDIRAKIEKLSANNILLIGHSYGALLVLSAALRMQMRNVAQLVLIDGPLNIDKPVVPTKPAHYFFHIQYKYRLKLASTCLDEIKRRKKQYGTENIVTIASRNDRIVPYETKSLPGLYPGLIHEDPIHGIQFMRRIGGTEGYNLTLPQDFSGHRLAPKVPILASIIETITPAHLIQPEESEILQYLKG